MEKKCSRKRRLKANIANTKARSRKSTSNNLIKSLRNKSIKRSHQKDLVSQMSTYIKFIKMCHSCTI